MIESLLKSIESTLDMDTDSILMSLGKDAVDSTHQILPRSILDYVAAGKAFLECHLNEIRNLLCGNALIADLATKNSDERTLAIAVADLLLAAKSLLPIAQISVLMARIGISRLCKDHSLYHDTSSQT